MKWLFKEVSNRYIKFLCNLDKEEGFMGMMLAMIMSVAIFTILSSVHIYTINHAQFQSGIKEAYIMQTDIENFATIVAGAYNKGREGGSCSPGPGEVCCILDTVPFRFKGTGSCGDLKGVCLKSSGGRDYCLVKLIVVDPADPLKMVPFPVPSPPLPMTHVETKNLRDCLLFEGAGSCASSLEALAADPGCTGSIRNKSLTSLCQIAVKKPYDTSVSKAGDTIQKCCNTYKLDVINCNDPVNKPGTCKGYETALSGKQRSFCEVCEMDMSTQKRLFTYYVCPATAGTPPNTDICANKMTSADPTNSGVFYQTFRVLAH